MYFKIHLTEEKNFPYGIGTEKICDTLWSEEKLFDFCVNPSALWFNFDLREINGINVIKRLNGEFYHAVVVTNIINGRIFVCSHTYDALNVPLSSYYFTQVRYIHILGTRK